MRRAYKAIYRQGLTVDQALETLEAMASEEPSVRALIDSLQTSSRGIIR
ncbi:hypothetical protein [Klebsiella pneumoniae]